MSFTALATSSTTSTSASKVKRQDSYTGSIFLTPTKKRRIDTENKDLAPNASVSQAGPSNPAWSTKGPTYQSQRPGPPLAHKIDNPAAIIDLTETPPSVPVPIYNMADIFNWTFTPESIATCWIKDVMELTAAGQHDFWWIGKNQRVPCRLVRICGFVVGVKVDEKQIKYTVDDGTAVIECYHTIPKKPQPKNMDGVTHASAFMSELPKPIAYVGGMLKVVGKPFEFYREERKILRVTRDAGSIEKCDFNDEIKHWADVKNLHVSHYDLGRPFEIPKSVTAPVNISASLSTTSPWKGKGVAPQTPSTMVRDTHIETPATDMGTPCTVHLSPEKSKSPQKLRHPSKLTSRNLTVNTFRYYVKHYMINAPPPVDPIDLTETDTEDEDSAVLATPTRRGSRFISSVQETPRPSAYSHTIDNGKTPRPRIKALSFVNVAPGASTSRQLSKPQAAPTSDQMGFTLSYLRRVPVLAELARRVVRAEGKRRAKAEYEAEKKKRESQSASTSRASSSSKPVSSSGSSWRTKYIDDGQTGKRMKRLFQQVLINLMQEGSIVLWDGPTRPIPPFGLAEPNESRMWKADSSTATADTSVFSTISSASQAVEEDMEMSDPDDNEEAYIPLTTSFLATFVESAIGALVKREDEMKRQGKLTGGATKEHILSRLKKDDRWISLGEWQVVEALALLKEEGRAWCVDPKRGKWELAV